MANHVIECENIVDTSAGGFIADVHGNPSNLPVDTTVLAALIVAVGSRTEVAKVLLGSVRISAHSVPSFRSKPFTHFGPSRSVVSLDAVHPFRSMSITCFGPSRSVAKAMS